MLRSIYIKDLALIDEVKIDFSKGFNAFTGETGAGKSIIIDAISLLLGNKADKNLIKEGKDFVKVEALFEIEDIEKNSKVIEVFDNLGIDLEDLISLSRTISITGKSEYRINGEICTLNLFKKISNLLLDVFGQNDNQQLLNSSNHIKYLDLYLGDKCQEYKDKFIILVDKYKNIKKEIDSLGGDRAQREREIDFLSYEIKQIEDAKFVEDEENELYNKKRLMINSEKIYNSLSEISSKAKGSFDLSGILKDMVSVLGSISGIDAELDQCRERLQAVRWEADDIISTLDGYAKRIDYDEKKLQEIEERLDLINDFKRKYGNSISDILSYLTKAKQRIEDLNSCEERIGELNIQKHEILKEFYSESLELHKLRVIKAQEMEKKILVELKDLGMKNSKFVVKLDFPESIEVVERLISDDGLDNVEFLFSANLGQSVRPLDKIVSGGELSRFSLAFKTIVNFDSKDKTLIFDEIDAGIGGNTGSSVGKKITTISRNNQVICITHLAQIASFADTHFKIIKTESNGKTYTSVCMITGEQKVQEIGRMIGSINNCNYAELHSKELINESQNFKNNLALVK